MKPEPVPPPPPERPPRFNSGIRVASTTQGVDDAALVLRARDGDRWAEEALYRRHVRRITDAATRILGRYHEAEDLVQDTFLTAFRKLHSLRDPALFSRWVMRIAMNQARSRLRKRKLLRTLGLDRSTDDATFERMTSPQAPPDVQLELRVIDEALSTVPSEARIAWVLHLVEGFTLPEVASFLGCSLATAKRRVRVARLQIEKRLDTPQRLDSSDSLELVL